jgi:hypothetical protein
MIDVYRRAAMPIAVLCAALALGVATSGASYAENDNKGGFNRSMVQQGFDESFHARNHEDDDIDPSRVQQGFDASPIPKGELNLLTSR